MINAQNPRNLLSITTSAAQLKPTKTNHIPSSKLARPIMYSSLFNYDFSIRLIKRVRPLAR